MALTKKLSSSLSDYISVDGSWQLNWSKERVYLENITTRKNWTYELTEFPYCPQCGRALVRGRYCWDDTRHNNLQFVDKTFQMGIYYVKSNIDELQPQSDILTQHIWNLKNDHQFAQPIGEAMAMTMVNNYKEMLDADLLIPIPSYGTHENHSKSLCDVISRHIEHVFGRTIKVQTGLSKTISTKLHKLSSAAQREEIVNNMFSTNEYLDVKGKKVILVDDLLTRGDTKNKCSRLVKLNGATKIWVYVTAGT